MTGGSSAETRARKRVLFTACGGTLGHVKRSLTVARALRRTVPEVEVSWLLFSKEAAVLEEAGETILPEAAQLIDQGAAFEKAAKGYSLNLAFVYGALDKELRRNFDVISQVARDGNYDLLVGDTTVELDFGFQREPASKSCPYVLLADFAGLDAMTRNPLERILTYYLNWSWVRCRHGHDLSIYLAHEEDIPDRTYDIFLPKRREFVRRKGKFAGYVPSWEPDAELDRTSLRSRLGYGAGPLVVCSVGGSGVGADLLRLCAEAYPLMKREIPDLHLVLVCGPRIVIDSLEVPGDVEVLGYVPRLYEYFAVSDLAVVHGGGTSALELTALRRPFLYFPLADHGEQAHVAYRVARWGSGIRMSFAKTSAEQLAATVIANIGRRVTYPPLATDGAEKAARLIANLLDAG